MKRAILAAFLLVAISADPSAGSEHPSPQYTAIPDSKQIKKGAIAELQSSVD